MELCLPHTCKVFRKICTYIHVGECDVRFWLPQGNIIGSLEVWLIKARECLPSISGLKLTRNHFPKKEELYYKKNLIVFNDHGNKLIFGICIKYLFHSHGSCNIKLT